MAGVEISLEQLLQSRDARQEKQAMLLRANPACTLVCLTVVVPGAVKRTDDSLVVAQAALEALQKAFGTQAVSTADLPTGFEAYLLTPLAPVKAKEIAVGVEDTHPLGRLFDVDVLSADGIPLSRADIGQPARKCLLCDREARFCMRNHSHTTGELLQEIHRLVETYV